MKSGIIIREIREEDRKDIEEISNLIWEGEDYLSSVFDSWLKDKNFYAIEVDGKVIGTGKISILPGKVGWMEGLRVHPNYQGRGLGKEMHMFLLKRGEELKNKGIIDFLEFATDSDNNRSINLGLKTGFSVVKKYYGFSYISKESGERPQLSRLEDIESLEYEEHIPCAWKFVRKVPDSLEFLNKRCQIYEFHGIKFLVTGKEELVVTPASLEPQKIEKIKPALNYLGRERSVYMVIPEDRKLEDFLALGFRKWEDNSEPEILLLRKKL